MGNKTKKCSKCGGEYPATIKHFNSSPSAKDGLNGVCKECVYRYKSSYYLGHREKAIERAKQYARKHKEEIVKYKKEYRQVNRQAIAEQKKQHRREHSIEINERHRKYYSEHKKEINEYREKYNLKRKQEIREYKRKWYLKHKSDIVKWQKEHWQEYTEKRRKGYQKSRKKNQEYAMEYYRGHKDKMLAYSKKYLLEHREERRVYKNRTEREKRENNIEYKIACGLRSALNKVLKRQNAKKSNHTLKLVGCTVEYLKRYLEDRFLHGMTWDNYGFYGWHIDHITPCVFFDLTKPKEQRKCFHYTNLQPLWQKDNLEKNSWYNGKLIRKSNKNKEGEEKCHLV